MRLSSTLFNDVWKTSSNEDSTPSLGRLFHWMIALCVKNVFFMLIWNLFQCHLFMLSLVFSMWLLNSLESESRWSDFFEFPWDSAQWRLNGERETASIPLSKRNFNNIKITTNKVVIGLRSTRDKRQNAKDWSRQRYLHTSVWVGS